MLYLVQQRAENLVLKAREDLASLGAGDGDRDDEDAERETEPERSAIAAVTDRIRKPARKDAKLEDFEFQSTSGIANPMEIREDGDVLMAGTSTDPNLTSPPRRTARAIRKDLSSALKEVVDCGVKEMEAYDNHAQEVVAFYRQALERRMERGGGGTGGGILRNGNEGLIDPKAIRRMSNGMPVTGVSMVQATRSYENMEELVRTRS